MDNFSKTCAAIILLLSLAAGAVVLDAKAEDYTPDEAAQEEQEQAPSIDTSGYVQVADPALYAKLDTLQESIDRLADALTPADAETDAEALTKEQPAPDYTAQLSGISAQLADIAQQATAETAEDADPFQKPFEEYTTGETLALIGVVLLLVFGVFSLFKNFVLRGDFMALFSDLLTFFGISTTPPQNLAELFPWLLAILVAVSLFLFVFSIIKDFTHTFARGKF